MNQKYFSVNVWVLFGVCLVLILFTFILVAHNEAMPNKIKQDSNDLRSVGKTVIERIKPIGQIHLGS
jgi:NADH:ubiquinone oxidoreductase subunit 6 (subunit J)